MRNDQPALTLSAPPPACRGPCRSCGREHHLGHGRAHEHCLELMRLLDSRKSLDLWSSPEARDPRLAADSLYGEARGKMFGVMECLAENGSIVILRAFSGQFNGFWDIDGWAPPLFDSRRMTAISVAVEKEIKRLGEEMAGPGCGPLRRRELQQQRRRLSQDLMRQMHGLYRLANFRGQETGLFAAYCGENGIPTGTGDCCAPKLLNFAARQNLLPLGMAEFYWGRENRSGGRQEGRFYSSCREKCRPILGFLLCGLEELHARVRP